MQFLDIVAADRKPEGHLPFAISEVQGHETVLWPAKSREQQHPVSLIAVPIVEEVEFLRNACATGHDVFEEAS